MGVIKFKKRKIVGVDENNEPETRLGRTWRYVRKIGSVAFVVLFLIATFFVVQFNIRYDVYNVEGPSMQPTLNQLGTEYNDIVYACKKATPDRGDIGIFQSKEIKNADNTLKNIVKRVIAIEGDTVDMERDEVVVAEEVKQEDGTTAIVESKKVIYRIKVKYKGSDKWTYIEENYLADDVSNEKKYDDFQKYKEKHKTECENGVYVPEGCYFVLGDNRENSQDSAVIGPVSICLGRVDFILYYNENTGTAKNFWKTVSFMFQLKF